MARRALVIATSAYADARFGDLRSPVADADGLAAVLGDPQIGGFDVELATDEEERDLRRRIARFFTTAERDDDLLLYLSCHGVKDEDGQLHLVATDTELDLLGATAISGAWLSAQIAASRSRRKLLLLDCCFSGKFPLQATARAGAGVDLAERFDGRGIAMITASNATEYAYEGDARQGEGRPSYFTGALIEGLRTGEADRDEDSWISVDELYDYLYDRVRERTPHQTPTKQITLEGGFQVARSAYRKPVAPAALDPALTVSLESPIAAVRAGALDEVARLLGSQDARVVLAARRAAETMVGDDSRAVSAKASALVDAAPLPGWVRDAEVPEAPVPIVLPPLLARVGVPLVLVLAVVLLATCVLPLKHNDPKSPTAWGDHLEQAVVVTLATLLGAAAFVRGLRVGVPQLLAAGGTLLLLASGLTAFPPFWPIEDWGIAVWLGILGGTSMVALVLVLAWVPVVAVVRPVRPAIAATASAAGAVAVLAAAPLYGNHDVWGPSHGRMYVIVRTLGALGVVLLATLALRERAGPGWTLGMAAGAWVLAGAVPLIPRHTEEVINTGYWVAIPCLVCVAAAGTAATGLVRRRVARAPDQTYN